MSTKRYTCIVKTYYLSRLWNPEKLGVPADVLETDRDDVPLAYFRPISIEDEKINQKKDAPKLNTGVESTGSEKKAESVEPGKKGSRALPANVAKRQARKAPIRLSKM